MQLHLVSILMHLHPPAKMLACTRTKPFPRPPRPASPPGPAWCGVSQAVLDRIEADLRCAGMPPLAWYDALLELDRAGSCGLRPFELQRAMLLAQYNTSRLVERLTHAGYVQRGRCPQDGRGQTLALTEAGREILAQMWPHYRAAIARHFAARLDPQETEALAAILEKLRD